jgi:heme O synthase-like polyprenyltransferase
MLFFLPAPVRMVLGILLLGFGVYELTKASYFFGAVVLLLGLWILFRAYKAIRKGQSKSKAKNYDE